MKVLWFTANACSALELLDPTNPRGGWLVSLEKELSCLADIDLHVGFYHGIILEPFKHGQTTFHPLMRDYKKNKFTRLVDRIYTSQYSDQKEIEKIKHLIDKIQPDIIHIHGTEDNFGLIQKYTRIPVVISIQGLLNPYIEKFFSGIPIQITRRYESRVDKLAFRTARSSYRKMSKGAERERRILQNTPNIIGRTGWDRAITRLLAPGSRYFIGQEMLRPSFYTKTWHNTPWNESIKIVTITSDSLYKGFEMIVKTAILLKEFPKFNFKWYVAGLNKRSYCVRVVTNWLQIDLESIGVRLLGNQNEEQLVDLLADSDVFCQVSHIENSPNSLCEAQLIGIPIIATDVGGTSSLVRDRETAIIVHEGDPFYLAGEIVQAYSNYEKIKLMADRGKKVASNRHNKEEIKNQYVAIYRELVDS